MPAMLVRSHPRADRGPPWCAGSSPRGCARCCGPRGPGAAGQRARRGRHVHRRGATGPAPGGAVNRILIAEDEPRIAAFVEKGLSGNSFAVMVVGDGPSAYDYAMTSGFDRMVLDIGLPGIDGFAGAAQASAREFAMTETVLRNPGQVLSREQLLSHVWGYDFDPGSNVVDVDVRYLWRKLGAERIATVRGMGYRLDG